MKEQGQKPEGNKIEEIDLNTRLSRNPVVWFGLLMVPIFLGLLVTVFNPDDAVVPEEAQPPAVVGAAAGETTQAGNVASPVQDDQRPVLTGRRSIPEDAGAGTPPCDFQIYVGRPFQEEQVAGQLNALKRPYRILPPGSMMTMDYSASRVNFDLDEQNVVRRVWCG